METNTAIKPGQKVYPKEMVTVYGTGKKNAQNQVLMAAGKSYEVHKIHAETLISKGYASTEKPADAGKGGRK